MKLTLDPVDLKPEFQTRGEHGYIDQAINTSQVRFEHLDEKAQKAVRVVGRGTFFNWAGDIYNAIDAPTDSRK